jgi:hypothetical protein
LLGARYKELITEIFGGIVLAGRLLCCSTRCITDLSVPPLAAAIMCWRWCCTLAAPISTSERERPSYREYWSPGRAPACWPAQPVATSRTFAPHDSATSSMRLEPDPERKRLVPSTQ